MATVLAEQSVLSDELLQAFGERAPTYDRENRFFTEDFEDLRLAGAELSALGNFAWAEPTFANIYVGIAQRAIDLAVADLKRRTSIGIGGRALAYHPMLQHSIAEMTLTLDGMIAHVDQVAADWSTGVPHGGL
jgi:hypothetical protein